MSMPVSTAEHLASLGVTIGQARTYVLAHAEHDLEGILELAHSHGITNSMLAEIVGGDITGLEVAQYFAAHGLDSSRLGDDVQLPVGHGDFVPAGPPDGEPPHGAPETPEHPEQPDHPEHPEHPETPVGPGEDEGGGNSEVVAGFVDQLHDLFDRPADMPQEPHAVADGVLEIVHAMVELIGHAPDLDGAGA